ncbi:MAG: rhomboid family intramembrane serine protease [Pseudomonadota bacterium]
MYNENADASPFNKLPPVIVALAAVMGAIELIFQAGESGLVGGPQAVGWRVAAIEEFGFLDPVWDWMLSNGRFPLGELSRIVSYPLVHFSFIHAAFAIVIILAIGKAVGEVFNAAAVLVIFALASAIGALAYGTLVETRLPLVGGYPGAYGLIGAFTFLLWVNLAAVGANSARAFTLIGVLMGIQLVFGVLFGSGYDWIADLAGFATGFVLSFVLSPGGGSRLLAKLRNR